MKNELLNSFTTKADEYFSTANSDSITYHDTKVNELLKIAEKITPDIISLYYETEINDNHKLIVLHLLDRLEYKWKVTRKEIPYNVESLKKVFLQALNHEYEALRFQAIKCSSIAEAIAREDLTFGDYYFDKMYEFLSDTSSRVRETTLFLLCCNAPDAETRTLENMNPLKKILLQGEWGEYFQALQYLRGKKEIYSEVKPELRKRLTSFDGTYELIYPDVFVNYLSKDEILDFVKKSIKLNSTYSLKSVIEILALNKYPETKQFCETHLNLWYEEFPQLRALLVETCTKLEIPLNTLDGNKINELPENEFLLLVSNKRVEGTLPRILKIFNANAILIFRGDGGFDILSALSFYKQEEVLKLKGSVPENIMNDILSYCKTN